MKKNLQHIDEIRFLIIHFILLNHWAISIYISKVPINQSLVSFWFVFTSPTLALISGYLFFYRTKDQFDFRQKVKTRIHSLIVPFLMWTIGFYLIYMGAKTGYAAVFHQTPWYKARESFSLRRLLDTIVNPPLVNFWYLQNLILVIPFNFLFYYLLKNNYAFFGLLGLILLVYAFNLFNIYFEPRFLPYYLIGAFLGYNEKSMPRVRFKWIATIAATLVLSYLICESSKMQYDSLIHIFWLVFIVMVSCFSIINIVDSNQNSLLFIYLKKYKQHSFFLFASNMFIFALVQRTLILVGADNYFQNAFYVLFFCIVTFVLVIILTFTIAEFLKQMVPKFYYTITVR